MELQRGIKRFAIGLFLLLFAVGFVPLSVFAAEEQGDADKIQITYYYFSSCESCEDGENYLLALEGQIEDAISPDEYEFHLKNVFEEDPMRISWNVPRIWQRTSSPRPLPCWM